jgi:ABC-2 type transport system permease protein
MSDALRAEWTKLTAIRGTSWTLVGVFALTVLMSGLITAGTHTDGCPPGGQFHCDDDLVELALGGVYLGQMAAAALGVIAIGAEFSSGMIRTTFAATPRRSHVLAAKSLVIGGLVLAAGLLSALLAYAHGLSILGANGYTAANGYPAPSFAEALRGVAGTGVYLAALAVLSLAIGALLRHTAAAITTVFCLLWVPLIVISLLPMDLGLKIGRWCPMFAGLAIQNTVERPDDIPIAPGAGLALLCAYAIAALAAGMWLVARRDA